MASWIKLTYSRRLFLGLVAYSAAMVACFAVYIYWRERDVKARELNLELQEFNAGLIERIDSRGQIAQLPPHPLAGLRVSVVDTLGRMVYDSTLDSLPADSHLDREEIAEALRVGSGYALRRLSQSTGQTYFYSAMRTGPWIIRSAAPYSIDLGQILRADFGFVWVLLAIAAGMCVVGYFATHRLGQNIRRLSRFADRAERGERIVDTEAFAHDELGEISQNIVRLYSRLQQANADRDSEHRAALHQQQEKERIKRQLTNNINHELKTPVAAMQICLETLRDHPDLDPGRRREFLDRTLKANRRLTQLLSDVAAITRMDDGGSTIGLAEVDVAKIIADTVDEYMPQAREAGMEIKWIVTGDCTMEGNADLIASIFRNLTANALAHSGGTRLTIDALGHGTGRVEVTVADDGCGVSADHLERIFERFYRVDKGRSRLVGGTGLGLSIVRNAVAWHGGTITASNEEGLTLRFNLGRRP